MIPMVETGEWKEYGRRIGEDWICGGIRKLQPKRNTYIKSTFACILRIVCWIKMSSSRHIDRWLNYNAAYATDFHRSSAEAVIISTTKSLMFWSTMQFHFQKRDHLVDALCLTLFFISKCFSISPMVERKISNYSAKHETRRNFAFLLTKYSSNFFSLRATEDQVCVCVCLPQYRS